MSKGNGWTGEPCQGVIVLRQDMGRGGFAKLAFSIGKMRQSKRTMDKKDMPEFSLAEIRTHAATHTLFPATSLSEAIVKLGFVQADPIAAPARAQDLILRHRVTDYRAGDLERNYPELDIEEDVLYAYGFMPRTTWQLLHPRNSAGMSSLEADVLKYVAEHGQTHPRDLGAVFGQARERNDWGGFSQATKRALESLHRRGLLRIVCREKGVRVYEVMDAERESLSGAERLRLVALIVANIFAPAPRKGLQSILARIGRSVHGRSAGKIVLNELIGTGALTQREIDGVDYVWPSDAAPGRDEAKDVVRFLAPFDPIVWDRDRFEHLWGWVYRFEAYTPAHKRTRGYYAMPLLWRDRIVGWANVSVEKGALDVDLGFVDGWVKDRTFEIELEREMDRMKAFLRLGETEV